MRKEYNSKIHQTERGYIPCVVRLTKAAARVCILPIAILQHKSVPEERDWNRQAWWLVDQKHKVRGRQVRSE